MFAQAQTNQTESFEETVITHRLNVDRRELIDCRYLAQGLDFYQFLSSHKKAHSMLAGGHLSPFKGRGMDFDEVRPYQPGDDIRNIDWNVTARSHRVHTKIFKEERERPVFLIVDYRSTMHFATRGVLKSVQAAKLAALSAWTAADKHNRIGGIIFSDDFQIECRPVGGSKGVLRLINYLASSHERAINSHERALNSHERVVNSHEHAVKSSHEANVGDEHYYQQPFTVKNLFERIRKVVKPGSLLVFISDFDFISDTNIKHLSYLSQHNDLINARIYDPLEAELPPPGKYSITQESGAHHKGENNNGDEKSTIANQFSVLDTTDDQMRQTYQQQFNRHNEFLDINSKKMGAYYLNISTNQMPKQALVNFFRQQNIR